MTVLLCLMPFVVSAQSEFVKVSSKIGNTLRFIDRYYVDTVSLEKLGDASVKAILEQLDPHSTYIPASENKTSNEEMEGEFEGVGIQFNIISDTLTVQAVIAGGPCAKAGVMAGDKFVEVDTVKIASAGVTSTDIQKLLRGPKGTTVTIKVVRRGVVEPLTFNITRDKIPLESIDAAYQPIPGVAYIKISRFGLKTSAEFLNALLKASNERRPNGIIIDLRGNGGGIVGAAIFLSDMFLSKGQMIFYSEGTNSPRSDVVATEKGAYETGPLVVMIDENSASASEIFTGAIQDWDRGVVVGRKSFGKGLIQRQFEFEDGSAARVTVARYYTPTGRAIQSPYEKGHKKEYLQAFIDRYERGESFSRDSISFPDSLKFSTLVKGRTVYGGGGIMPDVFVPRDTSYISSFYRRAVGLGFLVSFSTKYIDSKRVEYTREYPDFETFDASFKSDEIFEAYLSSEKEKGYEPSQEDLERSSKMLKCQLKALVARALFSENEFYRVINNEDEDFKAAVQEISNLIEAYYAQ